MTKSNIIFANVLNESMKFPELAYCAYAKSTDALTLNIV